MTLQSLPNDLYFLQKIRDTIGNGLYVFDLQKRTLLWLNEAVLQRFGFSLKDIQSMGANYLTTVMHPDDMPYVEGFINRAKNLKDGEVLLLDYRIRDKKGDFHWLTDRVAIFERNAKGEAIQIIGVAVHASERRAYEKKLETKVEKLNLSLAAAKMGTWEWDLESQRIIWDDRMYALHFINPRSKMPLRQEIEFKVLEEDLEPLRKRVEEFIKNRQDFSLSYRVRGKDTQIHHIRTYGKFQQDQPILYGVAWDYSDEIQTEAEMAEAKAKLISSAKMAALGEMSGGIAHEINNPLTVIQARAFQLSQMVENNRLDPEKIKQAAESISRTADKIAKIIKSLRTFAREGTQDPFELVPVQQIIQETLEFCKTRFYNYGVEVDALEVDPELELECRLIQIEQVLLNLLNNSFDAIQKLEKKWVKVSAHDRDPFVEIHVTDSGHGISKSLAEKIMHPFFTTKEVGKGTGLGLSISSGILKSHQGSLFVDESSEHTCFVIRLPKLQVSQ